MHRVREHCIAGRNDFPIRADPFLSQQAVTFEIPLRFPI
jgi:hypothetical protein